MMHDVCDTARMRTKTLDEGVSQRVRIELARRRLSAADAAKQVGFSEWSLRSRLNGNSKWTASEVATLAAFFGVPVAELYPTP